MRDLSQKIIKFNHEQNFNYEDFYVSKSHQHILKLYDKWPKWEKNFLNISGDKYSGKTHLINIFLKRFEGIKFDANIFSDKHLDKINNHQNIVLENLDCNINEKLVYSLLNICEQDNKYLIVTSIIPIVEINFYLNDLKSRANNFLLQSIKKPDDELIYALIVKNLSDRQISLEKKLVEYIIKRIERSYGKIFEFIYKIDKISLKKKKSIDLKIIKDVLGE